MNLGKKNNLLTTTIAVLLDKKEIEMTNPNEPPKIMTLEEMEAALKDIEGKKTSKTAARRNKKVPPPKQPSVAKSAKPEVPEAQCYLDLHFWLRDGDLFGTVCNDARDEKNFRGPGVTIFAHDHSRTAECSNNCKEIK